MNAVFLFTLDDRPNVDDVLWHAFHCACAKSANFIPESKPCPTPGFFYLGLYASVIIGTYFEVGFTPARPLVYKEQKSSRC